MTGGNIVRNKAANDGGGIFWICNGILALTGGVITENHADMGYNLIHWNANGGGGVFASHSRYGLTPIGSDPYIGGNIQIYNNTSCISEGILPSWNNANVVESNIFLAENSITVKQALGQEEGVPNAPLTDGAYVGISSSFELVITGENSKFDQASLKYLHSDADNYYIDAVLDDDNYRLTLVKQSGIIAYNKNRKEIVADIKEAGKYIVAFADYENNRLVNIDIVEYEFAEGINIVPQEITTFTLASDDKVMLWYDMVNLVPVCDALTIN